MQLVSAASRERVTEHGHASFMAKGCEEWLRGHDLRSHWDVVRGVKGPLAVSRHWFVGFTGSSPVISSVSVVKGCRVNRSVQVKAMKDEGGAVRKGSVYLVKGTVRSEM